MQRANRNPATCPRGRGFSHVSFRGGGPPANHRPHLGRGPHFSPNYWRDRPPGPLHRRSGHQGFDFLVELSFDGRSSAKADVDGLIDKCKCKPDYFEARSSGPVAASLYFSSWSDALETTVGLWGARLDGVHMLASWPISIGGARCDMDELQERLRTLFSERVRRLIDGDLVLALRNKLGLLTDEIAGVTNSLKKGNRISVYEELQKKKAGLDTEKSLMEKRILEFQSAMKSFLSHLERTSSVDVIGEGFKLFRFAKHFGWVRLHYMIRRECRRLEDGLPIYAFREEILRKIHKQQVMVLIGETGSGKSTQLVQYLADSGVAGEGSVICTQPRKLAAISLAQRVNEESYRCYRDNSVISFPTYSSAQQFNSKLMRTS
ncbi:RNA helicase [Bertholletia excelsa]